MEPLKDQGKDIPLSGKGLGKKRKRLHRSKIESNQFETKIVNSGQMKTMAYSLLLKWVPDSTFIRRLENGEEQE